MLIAALSQRDVYPKALANFLFCEIIEDAHSKYNISQEDMRAMNKEAVNRAMLFLTIKSNSELYRAFAIEASAVRIYLMATMNSWNYYKI